MTQLTGVDGHPGFDPDEWAARDSPGVSDERIAENTGHSWEQWRQIIDAWPGHDQGHAAIAQFVASEHGISDWWAQGVTVGYERMTGQRTMHERADGTFSATASRTVDVDTAQLRNLLLQDQSRLDLFPGLQTTLRSRPESKAVRLGLGPGVALFSFEQRDDGRARIVIAHEKLPRAQDVGRWKEYWHAWLVAVEEPPAGR